MKKNTTLNPDEVLARMRKYCAYQERCHQEVRYKLVDIGMRGEKLEAILVLLIEEGFLDEERFARAFTRGKFRNKQWGLLKIRQELNRREIGSYLQKKALEEIDPDEYRDTLENLLKRKKQQLTNFTEAEQKLKLFKYAYQRGFEPDLIYELIPRI
jgi:regulatory protein